MATADQVKALVKSHAEGDDARFYSVVIARCAGSAQRSRLVRPGTARAGRLLRGNEAQKGLRRPVPVAQPRGELVGLSLSATLHTVGGSLPGAGGRGEAGPRGGGAASA